MRFHTPSPRMLALGATVVAAAPAYGTRTQVGGGTADAARQSTAATTDSGTTNRSTDCFVHRGGGADRDVFLTGLARKLGVTRAELEAALDVLRPRAGRREGRHEALAKALGVTRAELDAAFDRVRSQGRRTDVESALAEALDVTVQRVHDAFAAQHKGHGTDRAKREAELVDALAAAVDVDEAEVRAVLDELRTRGGPGRHRGGPRGNLAAALAEELGVDQAKVTAALETLRAAREAEEQRRHDAFTQQLADRLGIDVARVRSALPAGGPGHHRGHHGGPGHHRGHLGGSRGPVSPGGPTGSTGPTGPGAP